MFPTTTKRIGTTIWLGILAAMSMIRTMMGFLMLLTTVLTLQTPINSTDFQAFKMVLGTHAIVTTTMTAFPTRRTIASLFPTQHRRTGTTMER